MTSRVLKLNKPHQNSHAVQRLAACRTSSWQGRILCGQTKAQRWFKNFCKKGNPRYQLPSRRQLEWLNSVKRWSSGGQTRKRLLDLPCWWKQNRVVVLLRRQWGDGNFTFPICFSCHVIVMSQKPHHDSRFGLLNFGPQGEFWIIRIVST